MKLPESNNTNHQYAFKKGYRLGQAGKPLSQIPGTIRSNPAMRQYFQMGWDQYQSDLAETEAAEKQQSPWRKRTAWFVVMIMGGIVTALSMIDKVQQHREDLNPLPLETKMPLATTPVTEEITLDLTPETTSTKENITTQQKITSQTVQENPSPTDLTLLSQAGRTDLALNKAQQSTAMVKIKLDPVEDSHIKVKVAKLTSEVKNLTVTDQLQKTIPKYIRQVSFFTQIENANGQTISHRWIYNGQIMATIPLKIKSNLYRTWSTKRLSSAWPGTWYVEVVSSDNKIIYRTSFNYIR